VKTTPAELSDLFHADPDRGRHFRIGHGGWVLDYSRVPITHVLIDQCLSRLEHHGLADAISRLFAGDTVNPSESQPALHMALRADRSEAWTAICGPDSHLVSDRDRLLSLAGRMHDGSQGLTDLLHIGIGGSDLGPRLVAEALDEGDGCIRVHWLSTLDGRRFDRLIRSLDPDTTGVVIASKSFSTEETLLQARAARAWLGERFRSQAWAATANHARAIEFGLDSDNILSFPAWVGGRFSLWSSVGISAAACIGPERFAALLAGAAAADEDFSGNWSRNNLAVAIAVLMHCLRRELDLPTLGVISYEPRLALLGDYLQQLIMESLGKGVDLDNKILDVPTAPLIFGGRGTDLQHSIFQALHQGLSTHPLVLVGTLTDSHAHPDWHQTQLAHLLAQATAFAVGNPEGPAYRQLPGNRPVALLLANRLTARNLGFLLASFEHAVFALSVLWQINPFDQWGVEEGKRLAARFQQLAGEMDKPDVEQWLDKAIAALPRKN
jgi:glucose-6-phosphate isomerase